MNRALDQTSCSGESNALSWLGFSTAARSRVAQKTTVTSVGPVLLPDRSKGHDGVCNVISLLSGADNLNEAEEIRTFLTQIVIKYVFSWHKTSTEGLWIGIITGYVDITFPFKFDPQE